MVFKNQLFLENTPTVEIILRNQKVLCCFETDNQFLSIPEMCRLLQNTWWIWRPDRDLIHLGTFLSFSYTNDGKILEFYPSWNIHLHIQFFLHRHMTAGHSLVLLVRNTVKLCVFFLHCCPWLAIQDCGVMYLAFLQPVWCKCVKSYIKVPYTFSSLIVFNHF